MFLRQITQSTESTKGNEETYIETSNLGSPLHKVTTDEIDRKSLNQLKDY